jgi:hypothetical protein
MDMTKLTPKKKARFVERIAAGDMPAEAARCIGMSRGGMYRAAKLDPVFAEAWQDASEQSTDMLESSAYRRAMDGDVALTIYLLKARRYAKRVVVAGDPTAPIAVEVDHQHHDGPVHFRMPHNGRDDGKFLTRRPRSVIEIYDPDDGDRVLDLRIDGQQVPADQIDGVMAALQAQHMVEQSTNDRKVEESDARDKDEAAS